MKKFLVKNKSKINGMGIFTKKAIEKGEIFYEIPMNKVYKKNYPHYAYIGNERYVCDNDVLNFVNHSCKPNTILKIDTPNPVLVAKKNIEIGEEITCDYEKTEQKGYLFDCSCKNLRCRKIIGEIC